MLELWRMRDTPLLPSLPGPFWFGIVALDRVLSMLQIVLNCIIMLNWIVWNRTVFMYETDFALNVWYAKMVDMPWNQTKSTLKSKQPMLIMELKSLHQCYLKLKKNFFYHLLWIICILILPQPGLINIYLLFISNFIFFFCYLQY